VYIRAPTCGSKYVEQRGRHAWFAARLGFEAMTVRPADPAERDGEDRRGATSSVEVAAVLGAVREDVRQTLRTAWLDPAVEAASLYPVFFTAAWSAIRPNVGKSFLALARRLRSDAVEVLRIGFDLPDLRKRLEGDLSDEEIRRIEESARAAHLITAKAQIVAHALHRAVRRERIPGTGREEPPIRRGVPEWQRWMSFQPAPQNTRPILDEVMSDLVLPAPPIPLRLLARWPSALATLWDELRPTVGSDAWRAGTWRLRRLVLAGISSLPHPVELQWTALRARGFTEEDRLQLADVLAAHDAAMPTQTLTSAFSWVAFGAPEIGVEG
jgi:hypothetical protein